MNKVENYRGSVTVKLEQVKALEQSVDVATNLFQGARPEVEYVDVLFAQRDLLEARIDMIETKQQQLSAIVNAYQALGGGYLFMEQVLGPDDISLPLPEPESDDAPGQRALPPTPAGTARLNDDSRTEDDVEWVPVVRKEIAPVEEPDNPALASE
jgi:hypothetical protein